MLYILKFSKPIGDTNNPRGQAQYYLGYCEDGRLNKRVAEHMQGNGACVTAAAVAMGCQLKIIATLPGGTRADERRYKKWNNNRKVARRFKRITANENQSAL